ncbi:MAG: NTP transferase domain-containing protein [candidate division Zixibacteria bacterium]|nr:NTP transferase domain-containing protein [candidate division Zixibacteria bacterium]
MTDRRAAIVLAAGKGKRMKSDLPKVLHRIHGRPIINILMDTLAKLGFDRLVVVVGFKGELVQEELADYPVSFVWQKEQLGTGHAVMMTEELMADFEGTTLVALGDVPFLSAESIEHLFKTHAETGASATCLSAVVEDASGYGRIIRKGESSVLQAIVEDKDATAEILKIREFNTGTFCFDNKLMFETIKLVGNQNAQGEYYLTDTIKIMHNRGLRVSVVPAVDSDEVEGINSAEQLERLASKFVDRFSPR